MYFYKLVNSAVFKATQQIYLNIFKAHKNSEIRTELEYAKI